MKAELLLKQNVKTLLKARRLSQHDLAMWCHRSDAWLSKILGDEETSTAAEDRGLPLKYLDRIADFFGVAAYQLFQPGITPLSERRKAGERRKFRDRRVRTLAQPEPIYSENLPLSPEDIALLLRVRLLSRQDRADIVKTIERHAERASPRRKRSAGSAPAAPESSPATTPATASRPARQGR
jgi:transcriptional regulator with XRE-family HTH domain